MLNGLRGIAIIGVIFWHLYGDSLYFMDLQKGKIPLFHLLPLNAFQGVALFFLLSAFVLYLPYVLGTRKMEGLSDVFDFYRRRGKRLLPLYFIGVLFSMIYIHPVQNLWDFVRDIFLMGTATFTFQESSFLSSYNFLLWTLSLEIWFSLALPFIILAIRKIRIRDVILLMVLIAFISRSIGIVLIQEHFAFMFGGAVTPAMDHLLCRLDDFAVGLLLAHLYVHRSSFSKNTRWLFCAIALILAAFALRTYSKGGYFPLLLLPFSNTILNAGFLFLIGYLLACRNIITRLASSWPLQMLGLMCYSLYIWHGMAIVPLQARQDLPHLLRYLFLLISFSWLTYRYIEHGHVDDYRKLLPQKEENAPIK